MSQKSDSSREEQTQEIILGRTDLPEGWLHIDALDMDAQGIARRPDGKVVFGSTVDLEDEDTGDKVTYQIVGEDEADLKKGLVNISSPIARALIGKTEGETAEVVAPGGIKRYEIMAVKYI